MSLAHGILGFLNYGTMTGYDLSKAFDSSLQYFWHAQNSQIYQELSKLEKKGLVTHQLIIQTDKPNKKLYSITEKGHEEFLKWLAKGNDSVYFKSSFLMKVFFSGNKSVEDNIKMFNSFIDDCNKYLSSMKSIDNSIEFYSKEVTEEMPLYWNFTADFGFRYIHMCIDWAESCIKRLEELQ